MLRKDRDTLAAIAEVFEAALEGTKDGEETNGVMMSAQDSHYDYSKPFAEQVDDWIAGKIPKRDTLVLGGTPEVLKNIGFSALPLTINQTHVDYAINNTKDADHFPGKDILKKLPSLIANPIAVIRSETHPNSRVVVIVGEIVNGKQMIAAVAVDGFGQVNNKTIDSNAVTTVFGKNNALKKLQKALQQHSDNSLEIYYWDKKIASALLRSAELQLPGLPPQGGYIGSIRSAASKVNTRIDSQTDTLQFRRWFSGSKAVNKDGTPMVMYHYSNAAEIEEFDLSRVGSNQGTSLGDGIYMSSSPQAFSNEDYGKYRHEWYAAIKKPYDATRGLSRRQATLVVERYGSIKHDIEAYDGLYKKHAIEKLMNPLRAIDYIKEYAKDAGIKTSDIFEDLGYDGIKNGNEWVAFKQTQIKSATKNIGLFDGDNTKLNFSKKEIADYTEKEYDSYGWAVVNEVLDETEQAVLFDRLSDKKNGTSFEQTHDKKYIFPVGEEFGVNNVLVVSNGNYYKPSIERIHRIMLDNETDIDIVRRYLYAAEKQGNRAVQALRNRMGAEFVRTYSRDEYAPYRELRSIQSRRQGSGSQTIEGDHREQRNGRGNDPKDRGTGLIFSMKDTTPADLTAVQEENESLNSALRLTEAFTKLAA